jgi:ATPase family AAA domain-containing protein 3A/B
MFRPFSGKGGKDDKPSSAISDPPPSSSADSDKESVHGFDPSALERAAKAARELDKSSNASGALTVIREQERTKQKELEARRAEYMAHQEQLAMRRIGMVCVRLLHACSIHIRCCLCNTACACPVP